jgi:hydrogenase nickel incorporation protein HypB
LRLRHSVGPHDRGQRAVARHERGYGGTQPDSLCGTQPLCDQPDGPPGAGKTALLEATIASWRDCGRIAVIEGDQATDRDSARIRSAGATAYQIETGLGCHLDAAQIHNALHHLELAEDGVLFIENVGNLVCPALFDLGEQLRVVVTSPTEGVDKALKYPPMFRAAEVVVLNKCDLLPHLAFRLDEWTDYVRAVNPHARIIKASALSGDGIGEWLSLLGSLRDTHLCAAGKPA